MIELDNFFNSKKIPPLIMGEKQLMMRKSMMYFILRLVIKI